MAQSVERLASAQVTILWFVSSSPESGSLSAQRLLWILLPPDSLCPSPACALALSLSLSLSLSHTHTHTHTHTQTYNWGQVAVPRDGGCTAVTLQHRIPGKPVERHQVWSRDGSRCSRKPEPQSLYWGFLQAGPFRMGWFLSLQWALGSRDGF